MQNYLLQTNSLLNNKTDTDLLSRSAYIHVHAFRYKILCELCEEESALSSISCYNALTIKDRPNMTVDVYHGRKTTTQQQLTIKVYAQSLSPVGLM